MMGLYIAGAAVSGALVFWVGYKALVSVLVWLRSLSGDGAHDRIDDLELNLSDIESSIEIVARGFEEFQAQAKEYADINNEAIGASKDGLKALIEEVSKISREMAVKEEAMRNAATALIGLLDAKYEKRFEKLEEVPGKELIRLWGLATWEDIDSLRAEFESFPVYSNSGMSFTDRGGRVWDVLSQDMTTSPETEYGTILTRAVRRRDYEDGV